MTAKHSLLLLFEMSYLISICALFLSAKALCVYPVDPGVLPVAHSTVMKGCMLSVIWPSQLEPSPGVKNCYHSNPTCPTNPQIGILHSKKRLLLILCSCQKMLGWFSNYSSNRTHIRQGSTFEKTWISWIVFLLGMAGSVWGVNKPKQRRAMQCLASVLRRIHLLYHTSHTHKLPNCASYLKDVTGSIQIKL